MKEHKICIIGDGLAGLMTAAVLSKENIKVDLFSNKEIRNLDNRTTAISDSNYQYIKKKIGLNNNKNFFWECKKINLYVAGL